MLEFKPAPKQKLSVSVPNKSSATNDYGTICRYTGEARCSVGVQCSESQIHSHVQDVVQCSLMAR